MGIKVLDSPVTGDDTINKKNRIEIPIVMIVDCYGR